MAAIDALPTELVEQIGALLPLDEFRALRISCRNLQHQLRTAFGKRFFRTTTIHLSESDLRKLHDISHMPEFGDHVQELVVAFEEDNLVAGLQGLGFVYDEETSTVSYKGSDEKSTMAASRHEVGVREAIELSKESVEV